MSTSVPVVPVVRLDKSRPFGTCHGDRVPEDPHYRVAFWQGGKIGKETITLPFDSNGELVPDDNRDGPWKGTNSEEKPVTYYPLWTAKMRKFLELKLKKLAERQADEEEIEEDEGDATASVDLAAWLRGEAEYNWPLLVETCKKKHGINFGSKAQMVTDLVIDMSLVKEEELSAKHRKMLPAQAVAA